MKFLTTCILAFAAFVLAEPIAEPIAEPVADAIADPNPEAVIPLEGPPPSMGNGLTKRQSCVVTGKGAGLNGSGGCTYTSSCTFVSVPGFCPGGTDYQCCRVVYCSGPYSAYTCRNTYKGCGGGGSFKTGYCPGDSGIKCCAY